MSRVLLIEDNPLTRRVVRAALAKEDCELLEAPDGKSALSTLARTSPDLVLLDLALPDVDAFALLTELRAHPNAAEVPILALTGLVSKADEARLASAAFDGAIQKPIEATALAHLVRGLAPAREAQRRPFGGGRSLLVVDDDPVQLRLAKFRLSKLGFRVSSAGDGVEALEMARRKPPDVIVTDVLMPRLDGFGLCLAAREVDALADVPIVLVTSSYVEEADRELAWRAGANAFVLRTSDLGSVVRSLYEILGDGSPPSRASRVAPPPSGEVESARAQRVVRQLERQVSLNAGLVQRCSVLASELAVLSTVAEALVGTRPVEAALFDVLASCLDVAGAPRGAIFVRAPSGTLELRAEHGFGAQAAPLGRSLDRARLLEALAKEDGMLESAALARLCPALEGQLGRGALLVQLFARDEAQGAMLLDAPAQVSEDWPAFARAIGTQVSLALSLGQAFERVERSERRARALMEHAVDAILVASEEGILLEANHAALRLLDRKEAELVGRRYSELIIEQDRPREPHGSPSEARLRATSARARRRDGTSVPVDVSSGMVTLGGERVLMTIVRDASERNLLAEQLRQAQKMEAIGRLAGGVAHDFNNLLSIIISYADLIVEALPSATDPIAQDLGEIRRAGERAAELTRQLLAFSRQQILQFRILHPNDILLQMEKMLKRLIGADIVLTVQLDPSIGNVYADASQLHQVLMNLVVNARDAMPHGGRLLIETQDVEIVTPSPRTSPPLAPGRYVVLRVADNGVGMDDATRARIFDPFFTTKDPGRGTGLGLSTVFGIVQQSRGAVAVESEVGRGTVFEIFLPRNDSAPEQATSSLEVADARGTETILIVDDETQLLTLARAILRKYGYRVLDASNAGEALLVAEQHEGQIQLLIADIVMPRMNGLQLAARLKLLRPEMRTLFMSGYSDRDLLPAATGSIELLDKPITPDRLARRVREVLDRRS